MKYSAMIIDIVNSKKLSDYDRQDIQNYIVNCLDKLNEVFKPSLEFDVVFSAGDEVQGLFKNAISSFLYFRLLKSLLEPIQIKCGIGIGEWSVRIQNSRTTEQDGPAYHNARFALNEVKKMKNSNILFKSESSYDRYINSIVSASFTLTLNQTIKQRELSTLLEIINPFILEDGMLLERYNEIGNLFREKNTIKYYFTNSELIAIPEFSNIVVDYNFININEISVQKLKTNNDSTITRGIPKLISEILGTTRQNTEKSIIRSNLELIRDLDLTVLIFIFNNLI